MLDPDKQPFEIADGISAADIEDVARGDLVANPAAAVDLPTVPPRPWKSLRLTP